MRLAVRIRNGPLERSGNGTSAIEPTATATTAQAVVRRGRVRIIVENSPAEKPRNRRRALRPTSTAPAAKPAPPNRWLWTRVIPTSMIVRNAT